MKEASSPKPSQDFQELVAQNLADEMMIYGRFNPKVKEARNLAKMLHRKGMDREAISRELKTRFPDQMLV